jgi:hypothetical protein
MEALIVDLPRFVKDASPSAMDSIFELIAERINIAAAYQRFCGTKLRSEGLSEYAQFKYQLMYDWACAEMNSAHHTAQRICELTGKTLRLHHDWASRRWGLEVSQ